METPIARLETTQPIGRNTAGSSHRLARLAGLLYLVIAIAAGIAHFYVPGQLIVPGNAAETTSNILNSSALFRIGVASEYLILLSEVVLSVLLYILLKSVNDTIAFIAMAFRLIMTAVHAGNLVNSFIVLRLLNNTENAAFAPDQLHMFVQLFLDAHHDGFAIGIVFLIPHMFALGYLVFTSGYFPRLLGALLIGAGCGYLIDSTMLLFVPGYSQTPAVLALLIAAGEIVFPLWLLVRGMRPYPSR